MANVKWFMWGSLTSGMLMVASGLVQAQDISGTISTTRTLQQSSRLVGDVTCTVTGAPCIVFGAPHIDLRLNGFTITGQADPANGCSGDRVNGENGISTNGQTDVEIRGPGVVQRFRAVGILFAATLVGKVEGVTVTTNCQAGILINTTSSQVTAGGNVAVRNGTSAPGFPCGGIWIQGSNNSLRWNETSGNGYAVPNDDFGIGIMSGNNNLVEENTAFGNTNGIVVFAAATNSRIRGNVVVGNPPVQLSVGVPNSVGVDIWNQSAPGANNVFDRNVCVTAVNAPCPTVSSNAMPRKPGG
jgi:parallel beta-helix repeat protein